MRVYDLHLHVCGALGGLLQLQTSGPSVRERRFVMWGGQVRAQPAVTPKSPPYPFAPRPAPSRPVPHTIHQ